MMIRKTTRILLRQVLGIYVQITIKKHSPLIIVIVGEENPSLVREITYAILSSRYNTRRNLERTESEFSIPLTVLGTLIYPKSYLEWLVLVMKTLLQLLYIKPYKHALVIQLHFITKDIFSFWMKKLSPTLIIDTGSQANLEKWKNIAGIVRVTKEDIEKIRDGKPAPALNDICKKLDINLKKATKTIGNLSPPATRINLIPGKNGSLIIDARHYYYPCNIKSITEIVTALPGRKYIFTKIKSDIEKLPTKYKIVDEKSSINPSTDDVFIFRGSKDEFTKQIKEISLNELEI